MLWYNKIAGIYDFFTSVFYKRARRELVNALDLENGNRVLVVACGTGQSFSLLEKSIGVSGEIVAFDYSKGMLREAEKQIVKNGWTNIRLFHMDASELSKEALEKRGIESDFDVVLGELAFTVIPQWKGVMEAGVTQLKQGGRLGLLDWYRTKRDLITIVVNYFAEAETTRKTLEFASELTMNSSTVSLSFFDSVFVWTGVKRQ